MVQERAYGVIIRVIDVLFKLMTLMQPKGLDEQDVVLKQLCHSGLVIDGLAVLIYHAFKAP